MNVCRASAGTGKTFTLAAYYVGLLLSGESYRNILAVTFTNKATAEMKERILGYLYGIATGTGDEAFLKKALELSMTHPDPPYECTPKIEDFSGTPQGRESVRARAEQCFREMLLDYDNVQVSTIDSFLQTLLAGMAKMLGKAAGFRVELNLKQVITKAVDRLLTTDMSPTLQQIMGDYLQEQLRQEGRWDIRQTLINLALDLYNEQVQMLVSDGKVELDEKTISGYKRSLDRWAQLPAMQNLQNMVAQARTANEALAKPDKDVGKAITRIERSLAGDRTLPSKDCFRWLTEKKLEKTTDPLLLSINEQAARCGKIYRECMLTRSCLNDMRLMRSLLQEIETCLQDENRMLLAKTADTLRNALKEGDADFVLEKAGIRYKHIMIDEFQDTSTLQWQVFQPLIADVLAGEGHTLLIVGDIKQSIYRWRNGDWHIMAELGTENDPFQSYYNKYFAPLVKNFRSRRNVVQFNLQTMMRVCDLNEENQKIKALYDEGYSSGQWSVVSGQNAAENLSEFYNTKNDGGFVRLRVYPRCRATKKETATLAEQTLQTERVQQDILTDMFATIRQLLDKGERASDIMILVRTNKQAQQVVDFYNAQVDWRNEVRIVSADSFHIDQSQSVQMIINALLATDPAQNIALRYVDLHLPEDHPAKANLQERLAATNDLPLYEQVQAIVRLLLCDEQGMFLGDDLAYVNCFMDKLMNYVATEGANRQAFLQYWADMMHTDSISAPDSNAMRIMSIHSSKGLESKTLFIPFCNWAVVDNTKHPNLWCEACVEPQGNVKRLKQVPIPWKQAMEGTDYEAAYQQEAEAQRVDNLNLLYVALTRAADNLYLYTDWLVQKKEGEVDQHVGTLLMNAYGLKEEALEAFENYSDETKPCFAEYILGDEPYIHRPKQEQKADLFSFRNAEEVQAAMQSNDDQVRFRQSQESMLYGLFGEEKAEQMIAHINIGSLCHDILAHMVTREEQQTVLERYMQRGVIGSEAQRREVESLLNRAWENPQMCEWFDGSWDLLCEQAMMVNGEEKRPDRVMLKGDKAIVLDYKFGSPNPKYHKQVADYMEVMRLLGYREVEGYLWYAQQGKMEKC